MKWIKITDGEPKETSYNTGWSSHVLVYSTEDDFWHEAIYHYETKKYYTVDGELFDDGNLTHFCEEIETPNKNLIDSK